MNTIYAATIMLMIIAGNTYAHTYHSASETNETISQHARPQIAVQSVRGTLGAYDTTIHAKGQLRAGYITLKEDGTARTNAYAMGGHVHLNTDRWYGLKIGLSAYTVLDLGINQNPIHQNPDFFDAKGKSFATLSKAFLDGKWGNTQIRLGRQALDTPLADSDDIRMMPNYFQAYTLTNTDLNDLTLTVGYIDKMAGWENGVDASRFVDISKVLGTERSMNGVGYIGTVYEGIEDLSLSLWYYRYNDVADIFYAEAGYTSHIGAVDLTLGLQYAHGKESGKALLGTRDNATVGASLSAEIVDTGLTITSAYNKDNGQTGAVDLSLGGGPFFTSMEDQTIDAIAGEGTVWMLGAGYDFTYAGIEGLNGGIAYGLFKSDTLTNHYHASETDIVAKYTRNDHFTLTFAYALIDHKDDGMADYNQLRVIGSYSF